MNKTELRQIILDQKLEPMPERLVDRWQYTQIMPLLDNKQIIILSGIRRCGKSTLMYQLRQHATQKDYYINFDDDRLIKFQVEDFQLLIETFIELYGVQDHYYFDEIQNVPYWERFIRRLHNEGKKIFITGSNARLLSSELGTHLTGRHIPVKLFPYSFAEYLSFVDAKLLRTKQANSTQRALIKKYFLEYKQFGGMPEYLEKRQQQYLHTIYENILYKDIIVRNKLPQERAIKELVYYLASNNAKEFSYNSLKKLLGLGSSNTVSEYCQYLENSFLCFTLNKFAYSVKEQQQARKKIYFIDPAIAQNVGFHFSADNGRILENLIFLQLLRQNQEIYYHRQSAECDFIVRNNAKISAAIQVSISLQDEKTKSREIKGLVEAMESYDLKHGIIITEDETDLIKFKQNKKTYQIEVIPCWQWLLEQEKR